MSTKSEVGKYTRRLVKEEVSDNTAIVARPTIETLNMLTRRE